MADYVHGYDEQERRRLSDQAATLAELLHADTCFAASSSVLEAGCGTGAQTLIVAQQNPGATFTAVDISAASLGVAQEACQRAGIRNVTFQQADLLAINFAPASFDHVVVCFVLEHLPEPDRVLHVLKGLLRPGGSITVIEGDHGSTLMHPDSVLARRVIQCQVALQARAGGDAHIGRRLFPLLAGAGFSRDQISVSPRMVYVDGSKPDWIEGFTRNTFTAMIRGVREKAVAAGLITAAEFDQGIEELLRTAEADGVFGYTFFKAVARA